MSSPPKILVLGATGKVGGAVVRHLRAMEDVQVVAAVRSQPKAAVFQHQNINTVPLDLDQADTVPPALKGIDRALLLTGYSVDMLRQSKRFIDAAKAAGVHHIVHIGASGAPTNEVAHWGWHQYVEAYIETRGFSYTHLRPEAFMQNLWSFGWLQSHTITHYVGNARWSWVDCDDLALVAAQTLHQPERYAGQIIPLGYDAKTFDQVAQILTDVVGRPFWAQARLPEEFLEAALSAGADPAYMTCVYTQFKLNAAGKIPNSDATFDTFAAITGRTPTTWPAFAHKHRDQFLSSLDDTAT